MSEATKQCPFCAETIQAAAVVCRYCGRDLAPAVSVPHVVANGSGGFTCSVCGGGVRKEATSCKHCQTVFGAPSAPPESGGPRRLATPSGPQCSECQASVAAGAASCPNCTAVFVNAPPAPVTSATNPTRSIIPLVVIGALLCIGVMIALSLGGSNRAAAGPDPISAYVMCKQFMTERLKSPATADFPTYTDASTHQLSATQFRVNAFVDSQNSFGANVRTAYTCTVTSTGGPNWRLDSLTTVP